MSKRAVSSEASAMSWQEESEMSGKALWQEESEMSGKASWQEESEMSGKASWQEESEMFGKLSWQKESAMPERAAGYREAVMHQSRTGREEAVMHERTAWPGETAWEEENAHPEGAVLQENRFRTARANRTGRQPYRAGHGGETREWQKARIQRRYRGRTHRDQQAQPAGHPIASPVAGQVDVLEGQGHRGVLLTPEDNKVYAPASGKIIRLYPRGNEFLLRTDSGVVLRLRAGERDADMTRDYFRPRIMQNEFVGKGKLLLEYDREALARDGYDTHVSMTVEEEERSYDLSVTGSMWVKNGQDCLWVL